VQPYLLSKQEGRIETRHLRRHRNGITLTNPARRFVLEGKGKGLKKGGSGRWKNGAGQDLQVQTGKRVTRGRVRLRGVQLLTERNMGGHPYFLSKLHRWDTKELTDYSGRERETPCSRNSDFRTRKPLRRAAGKSRNLETSTFNYIPSEPVEETGKK